MVDRASDALGVMSHVPGGGYIQVGGPSGPVGNVPGPGSYLDMSQDSSFAAAKTNE